MTSSNPNPPQSSAVQGANAQGNPAQATGVESQEGVAATGALVAKIGLLLGPAVALLMLWLGPPEGLSAPGWHTLALLAWMAVWWVSEPVPIAATSLLPIVWLPLGGIATAADATSAYADPIIFLFIGGFMLAFAIERWQLHRRIALGMIAAVGTRPVALVGSFALASCLLSMWISNTATALMLMPTALGVAAAIASGSGSGSAQASDSSMPSAGRLAAALVLMVAYGASIGGIGTPIGSPTNLVAMGYLEKQGLSISFVQWMTIAIPLMLVMLLAAWAVLAWPLRGLQGDSRVVELLSEQRRALGAITAPERRVSIVFILVALAWMSSPLLKKVDALKGVNDTAIAIAGVLLLFMLPAGDAPGSRTRLLDWKTAERIPWGVALLFGGGLSVAAAMDAHGVSQWLGEAMSGAGALNPFVVLLLLAALTVFASEFMSNTATLAAFLPVIGAISLATGLPPLVLAFNAAMAASLAFMMPVGTPPNAIAYGTGQVKIGQMIRVGLWLNLVSIAAITVVSEWWAPVVLG
jgi:solute carrier family 13 (sodium-dependent dicarboxylate transporter), member 2/3/5